MIFKIAWRNLLEYRSRTLIIGVMVALGVLLGVLALCTFTMVLPTNVSTTLSNPQVATYLGVGQADLRIDVRTGVQDLATVEKGVDSDPDLPTLESLQATAVDPFSLDSEKVTQLMTDAGIL